MTRPRRTRFERAQRDRPLFDRLACPFDEPALALDERRERDFAGALQWRRHRVMRDEA
jgi:hypothetical protein